MTTDAGYGPLKLFVGIWEGNEGLDISPEPDGTEQNPYYEKLVFTEAGVVENAEVQELYALHYRQIVSRKSTQKIFHQETGFLIWDALNRQIIKTLSIPRGLSLVAGSQPVVFQPDLTEFEFEVYSGIDDNQWRISNAPFLQSNAKTREYTHKMTVTGDQLFYKQTMILDIYGSRFEHTDQNELFRKKTG